MRRTRSGSPEKRREAAYLVPRPCNGPLRSDRDDPLAATAPESSSAPISAIAREARVRFLDPPVRAVAEGSQPAGTTPRHDERTRTQRAPQAPRPGER